MNIITVAGNIGAQPVNQNKGETNSFTRFSIADNQKVKQEEVTMWFECVAFGKKADILSSMEKGKRITVSGTLQESSYTDQEGNTKKSLQLIVRDFNF